MEKFTASWNMNWYLPSFQELIVDYIKTVFRIQNLNQYPRIFLIAQIKTMEDMKVPYKVDISLDYQRFDHWAMKS